MCLDTPDILAHRSTAHHSFTGVQGKEPTGFNPAEPVRITAFAPKGTTFVDGFNAFLNIVVRTPECSARTLNYQPT